jgi:hypothetical protein
LPFSLKRHLSKIVCMYKLHYPGHIGSMLKEPPILKIFFLFRGSDTLRNNFSIGITPRIQTRIRKCLGYESGAHLGSIHEKNQRLKISCNFTFNAMCVIAAMSVSAMKFFLQFLFLTAQVLPTAYVLKAKFFSSCFLEWVAVSSNTGNSVHGTYRSDKNDADPQATAPYFYGSILLRALKSKIISLLTYAYKK